ncbi:P-loop containing nucleoside triphosphate hydrolase protein [Zopfochytrium polystomum]|nr:P-loop containing nucleoside triphosphate hydrolase protein [Zopfochytrium polystomum]
MPYLKVIKLTPGSGGDGGIHFMRSITLPLGPPGGGNGGRGGDIYIVGSKELTSFNSLLQRYRAGNGGKGGPNRRHGANGADIEVVVPIGTIVRQVDAQEEIARRSRIERGERFLLARGGSGGLGNPHYAPPQNRLLRGFAVAGRGEPGEAVWIEVELRTLADAGLVGLPNAGKSTLLRAISGAKPRVSDHPFTTLRPHVGTVEHDGDKGWSAHVADVPGLVEGAHLDVGLGHSFLRHIERCKVLLYVVDLAGLDPARDLRVLREELEKHQEGLSKRKCIVVANKADLSELARSNLEALVAEAGPDVPVIPVSAKERKNVEMVVLHLRKLLADLSN